MELALDFISAIFIQIALFYFFGKLSNKRASIKRIDYLIVLLVAIIQVILNLCDLKAISALITFIYMYFLCKRIYLCKYKEALIYSIITWIISLLVDILVMSIVNLTGLTNNPNINIKLLKGIGSNIMATVLFILSKDKKLQIILNKIYQKLYKINIKVSYIIVLLYLFFVIDFISSIHLTNHFLIMALFGGGLIILGISTLLLSLTYKIYVLKETNSFLEKNDEIYRRIITDYRMLKHNLESQLLGIKSIADKKSVELLDNLIQEYNQSFYIKHDINSMPTGINGIILEKMYNYNNVEIQLSINNRIQNNLLNELGPRNYNALCESLGVTLDNALYASSKSREKILYLRFMENNKYVIIQIGNSFSGIIDIEKVGTLNYTSKNTGHGLGLYSLLYKKKTDIKTNIINNLFITEIKVKKNTIKN